MGCTTRRDDALEAIGEVVRAEFEQDENWEDED